MIQQGDLATYEGKQVKVLEIYQEFYGNRLALVDENGKQRKVPYNALKKPQTNNYKVKKTADQVLAAVILEIDKIKGEYCIGNNDFSQGGRIVLDRLKNKLTEGK